MSALIIRLPEEKPTRLKLVAKSRKVSATKLDTPGLTLEGPPPPQSPQR